MAQRQLFQRGWSACALLRQPGQILPSHVTSSRQLQTTACRLNHHIINVQDTEDYKKRVLDSKTPVIVDFHAAWCGPCKMLGPRLESLVSAHSGKVLLAKVDIDDNSELAMEHGVEAVPTVLALRAGKVVDKFIGMKDDASLKTFIDGLVR